MAQALSAVFLQGETSLLVMLAVFAQSGGFRNAATSAAIFNEWVAEV